MNPRREDGGHSEHGMRFTKGRKAFGTSSDGIIEGLLIVARREARHAMGNDGTRVPNTLEHIDDGFVTSPNSLLQDTPHLSFRAKGVLITLLSYPHDWSFNMKHIISRSSEGRDAVITAMKELVRYGYVRRVKFRDPDTGQVCGERTQVSRYPQEAWIKAREDRATENPASGFPGHRKPRRLQEKNVQRSETKVSEEASASSPEPKRKTSPGGKKEKGLAPGPVIGAAMKAWAEHKHFSWPELTKMDGRGAKYCKEFLAYFDGDVDEAVKMMELGIKWAAEKEDWWRSRGTPLTFNELAAGNKIENYALKADHAAQMASGSVSTGGGGAEGGDAPLLGRRMAYTAYPVKVTDYDPDRGLYFVEFEPTEGIPTPEPMWLYPYDIKERE